MDSEATAYAIIKSRGDSSVWLNFIESLNFNQLPNASSYSSIIVCILQVFRIIKNQCPDLLPPPSPNITSLLNELHDNIITFQQTDDTQLAPRIRILMETLQDLQIHNWCFDKPISKPVHIPLPSQAVNTHLQKQRQLTLDGIIVTVIQQPVDCSENSGPDSKTVTETKQRVWQPASTGSVLWDCSVVLALYTRNLLLEVSQADQANMRILELGAGTALCGLLAAQSIPAACVALTDLPNVLPVVNANWEQVLLSNKSNSTLLSSPEAVHIRPLLWGDDQALEQVLSLAPGHAFDLVLASDCVFFQPAHAQLLETLRALVRVNQNVIILIAHEFRVDSERNFFERMCPEAGFRVSLCSPPTTCDSSEKVCIYVNINITASVCVYMYIYICSY